MKFLFYSILHTQGYPCLLPGTTDCKQSAITAFLAVALRLKLLLLEQHSSHTKRKDMEIRGAVRVESREEHNVVCVCA